MIMVCILGLMFNSNPIKDDFLVHNFNFPCNAYLYNPTYSEKRTHGHRPPHPRLRLQRPRIP